MSLKRIIATTTISAVMLTVAACGGGGGGSTSTGGVYFSHSQLADEFVRRAYTDTGIDVSLVKTNTEQYGFIVVRDNDYHTYDAYDIDGWRVGTDLGSFIDRTDVYVDLDYIGNNRYQDYNSGLIFEETAMSSKDLEKVAAVKQALAVKKSAKNIMSLYGLSEERSVEVARLAVQVKNTPASSMTNADYDNFSKELLGSSITAFEAAIKKSFNGNSSDMNSLIEKAATANGVGPEHMQKIVESLIVK